MSLRPAKRIPRRFNRTPSKLIKAVVKRRHPMRLKRKSAQVRNVVKRRSSKVGKMIFAEVRIWLIILVSGALLIGIVTIIFSPYLSIKQITVRRQDARLDIEEVQKTLSPLFGHRLFLVTTGQVNALLTKAFPDVISASISKTYPSTLTVALKLDPLIARLNIEESQDSLPSSGSGVAVQTGTGGFAYLTAKGFVVLSPVDIAHSTLPTFTIRDWGVRPTHRSFLFDPSFIATIFEARKTLSDAFDFQTTGIAVYVRAQEFHLGVRSISLWFDTSSSLTQQFDRLRQFLRTVSLQSVKQYIDLRLSDRVVYK